MDLQEGMIIKRGYNYTLTCPTTNTWDYINVFDKYYILEISIFSVTKILFLENKSTFF
jgi:hypothetical protein